MKCQCSVNVYQINKDSQLLLTIKMCFKIHSQFQAINSAIYHLNRILECHLDNNFVARYNTVVARMVSGFKQSLDKDWLHYL